MPENNNRIIPVSESFFNEKFDSFEKLDSLEGKERERYADFLTSIGELAPTEDNVFTEAGQAFAQTFVGMGHGLGATLNEAGLGSGVQNYFQGILNRNRQWNAPKDMGAGTYIARAIGGGVGSTIGTLGAGVTATLATGNPVAGAAAAGVTAFAQTFGNNVQRNRKAGYSEDKAYGMAFLESAVDSAIESSLGVVGKGTKVALNLGRIRNISNAGKKELLNRIGRKMAAQVGKEEAQNLLLKWGKETAKDGLSEGFEEGLQYLNTYVNRSIGGDPDAKFSLEEFADNIAQGIIAGFAMGGVTNYAGVRRDAKMRIVPEDIENGAEMAPVAPDAQSTVDNESGVTPASMPTEQPLFDTLVTEVGNALGINIDFMDNREDFAGRQSDINGFYDKGNKTLYLNRNSYAVNPAETLGHELKHYIDDTDSELSKAFDALVEEGKNEAGDKEILELAKLYDNDIAQGKKEFSSDVFGKLFARPETWQKMAEKLDAKTPGMGEKFLQTLRDFYTLVKNTLFKMASPEAETFLNNVDELQNEAARMLAELRKKKASASASQGTAKTENTSDLLPGTAKTENASSPLTETAQQHSVKYNERIGDIDDSVESIEKSVSEIQQNEVVSDIDSLAVGDYVDMGSTQGWVRSIDGNNITISPNSDLDKKITVSKENYQRHFTAETAGRINDLMGKLKSAKAAKVHEAEAVKEEKELDGRKAPALPAPEEKMVSAENAQTTKEDTKEEPVGTDKVATADKSSEVEPEKEGQTDIEFKDRSAELGVSFDEFYKKFKPSLNAILAKVRMLFSETLGNDIEEEWQSAADKALVNAYMKYPATGGKAELKTYASKAVINAINSVNREHKRNFKKTGGNISLDQTNDQGEALSEVVADENQAKESDTVSARENPQEAIRRISESKKLSPVQKKIVDLLNQDFSPSVVMRKLGMRFGEEGNRRYMSPDEFQLQMAAIRTIAEEEGVLYSRKRGTDENGSVRNGTEENEIIIDSKNPQYKMPSPFEPKDLKKWLKEFYKQKEKPINKNTGWTISVPGTGIEETLNHLYRNRKNYRSDLHYLSLPYIDKMLENAEFEKFDEVEQGKNADAISIFNVIVDFGDQGKYNARMVIKHFGEAKNFYDHKLTEFEELSDLELQSEDSGSLNNSSTSINIPQSGEKSSPDLQKSRKRLHQQINPVVQDGVVRDEYADLLSVKEYTPETLEKWSKEAMEWILKQGGVKPAAEQFLKNHAPAEKHVATLARRMIINSDVYANAFTYEQRVELNEQEIDDRSSWGKQGRAMQLAALKLDDIAAVQALLNKLHEKMPPEELKGLRNKIMEKLGIDIYKLPDDIVNNKEKLDALLREELAHKGDFKDKLYEYWINAILSGPGTHVKNILGNTANAAYELGIKRFTEAMVNIIAGKKDGATFGEFKEMMKAFNWENARKAISQAYQLEVLDDEGKFSEKRNIAIGGGLGRFIRIPGRALKAADAFARAIIQPMETAAYAYRLGVSEGMTGERLQMFIQKQLTTPDSKAYQWGTKRSKELTFQEDSPQFINTLMALRESDGFLGHALKVFLPFIKTPYNILKQGVRKSPLGAVSLAIDTFQRLKNEKGFDGEYVSRMAEQLLAWGTVMAIAGLSDDDDLPLVTGASAKYGSAERGFKANKLPPFSIRIGGRWFSYAGIEPFATSLAAIVDSVKIYDKARNGKDGTLAMKEMLNSVGQIVVEKSYIDSVNEMIRMVQDPERELHRPITNTVASLVPNFYRQARQAFVDTVPDNKSRERGMEFLKDQFIIVSNKMGVTTPMPKIDFFGREVKKDSFGDTFLSPAGRLLAIRAFDADDNMDKAEKLIWDYNKKNPENPWYPDLPAAAFKLNGKKVYLAGEDYQNYAIDSGKLAHRQINNAIRAGRLKLRNPDEQDIELVKKIFSRARKETKQKYLRKVKEI